MSGRDCRHGSLARSCEVCELEQQVGTLESERGFLRSEAARLRARVIELEEGTGHDRGSSHPCVGCERWTNGYFTKGTHGSAWYCGWCEAIPAAHDGPTRHAQGSIDAAKAFGQGLLRDDR